MQIVFLALDGLARRKFNHLRRARLYTVQHAVVLSRPVRVRHVTKVTMETSDPR